MLPHLQFITLTYRFEAASISSYRSILAYTALDLIRTFSTVIFHFSKFSHFAYITQLCIKAYC